MTEVTELRTAEEAEKPKLETTAWSVLMLDPDTVPTVTRWIEQEPIVTEGIYPYITAEQIGEAFGEGEFLVFREDDRYLTGRLYKIVADRVYREQKDDEA